MWLRCQSNSKSEVFQPERAHPFGREGRVDKTADVRTVTIDTTDRTLGIQNIGSGAFRRVSI